MLLTQSTLPLYGSTWTRLLPAGVRSSGNFMKAVITPVGCLGSETKVVNAPGRALLAIAITVSTERGFVPAILVAFSVGVFAGLERVSQETTGSATFSNVMIAPVAPRMIQKIRPYSPRALWAVKGQPLRRTTKTDRHDLPRHHRTSPLIDKTISTNALTPISLTSILTNKEVGVELVNPGHQDFRAAS